MEKLSQWLKESKRTVIFTGAGMSTESGLPDFRSRSGLWQQKDPTKLASTDALEYYRDDFFNFYQSRMKAMQHVKPNSGHIQLAQWESEGLVHCIITQNVDGLHQKAGSKKVAELHGNITSLRCHKCGEKEQMDAYLTEEPNCKKCGGFLRPNVVLFGEMLPEEAVATTEREINLAELFIVLGSSLTVTPASTFPQIAKQNGATLVIINQEKTPLDPIADLVIHNKKIGEALEDANEHL